MLDGKIKLPNQFVNVRVGSFFPFRGAFDSRPESGAQPKQVTRKLTFALETPKLVFIVKIRYGVLVAAGVTGIG